MPQGRHRQPFSGKAKKQQLQEKKQRKAKNVSVLTAKPKRHDDDTLSDESSEVMKINVHASRSAASKSRRYALHFYRDTDEEISLRKQNAQKILVPVEETALEIKIEDYFTPDLDFPKRPAWNYFVSARDLEIQEQRYFSDYVSRLQQQFKRVISYFELNLETWRQFWRVLEMSDIFLVIVDIRYPALMFPPSLYIYITEIIKKEAILVFNKVDLAPPALVAAWQHYFKQHFPQLHIVMFTSFPGYNLWGNVEKKSGLKVCRRKGRWRMAAEGAQKLFEVCKDIVKDDVDLTSWHNKIMEEMSEEVDFDGPEIQEITEIKKVDTSFVEWDKYSDGVLTIGCIGQPNVGKSSLLNALMGRKVVSVSRTPGHTKHFQTIFLTPQVKLCDCPGLVFPSKVPRALQVLMGSYPIAHLREPYSSVQFLAERMDLPRLLSLQHVEGDDQWCAFDICEAWAKKKGFFTARAGRLDMYRAANHLLRMTLEGKICLCFYPPEYCSKKDYWEKHETTKVVQWIQAKRPDDSSSKREIEISSSEDEEEEGSTREGAVGFTQGRLRKKQHAAAVADDDYDDGSEGNSEREDSEDEEGDDRVLVAKNNKFAVLDDSDTLEKKSDNI